MVPRARSSGDTRLVRLRVRHGLRQEDLARLIGVSVEKLRAVERPRPGGQLDLRVLVNAAMVLGVPLREVLEDEWLQWHPFDRSAGDGPPPGSVRR